MIIKNLKHVLEYNPLDVLRKEKRDISSSTHFRFAMALVMNITENLIYVYANLDNEDVFVGQLWSHYNNGKESASFRYDENWLKYANNFELEPFLPLREGTVHTDNKKKIFASFSDSAPDTWGRLLIKRYEANVAKLENRMVRNFNQLDFLLAVNDFSRHGAIRFKKNHDGVFLKQGSPDIPLIVDLQKLLMASEKIIEDSESFHDIKELLIPGSSLGGARPKASVIDKNGNLFIAKFPKKDDNYNNVLWEAVALTLARLAGLRVQDWQLMQIHDKPILLLKRFDRQFTKRIPFILAMSMLNANDGESNEYSYLDIVDIIRTKNVHVLNDMKELWSRVLFSVLISNTDDHLRNHGFIRIDNRGWTLSPLYDVNPSIDRVSNLQLNIDESDSSTSIDLVLSVAEYFGLSNIDADNILKQQIAAVSRWQEVAKHFGIRNNEISRLSTAFRNAQ